MSEAVGAAPLSRALTHKVYQLGIPGWIPAALYGGPLLACYILGWVWALLLVFSIPVHVALYRAYRSDENLIPNIMDELLAPSRLEP